MPVAVTTWVLLVRVLCGSSRRRIRDNQERGGPVHSGSLYVEEEEQHLCHVGGGGGGLCDTLLFMFVCLFLFVGVVFVFVFFNCFPFLYLLCTYRIQFIS